MIVLNPTVHHSVARLIENHAHGFVVSQLGFWIPTALSRIVSRPNWLLSSHHHSSPTTAMPNVHGAKKIARKTFRPGYLPFTMTASRRPATTRIGVEVMTKRIVFQTPVQKTGKW